MNYEASFGHWIASLYRSSQNHLAKKLARLHIGRGQHSFLLVLFNKDGVSQDYLAKALNMNKAAVARAVSKLEDRGYLTREKDDSDRRNNLVYLTDKARKIKSKLMDTVESWTDVLSTGLSIEESKQLVGLLKRMGDNADKAENSK
jgi:DNA-binding MarR family transcriptional regulator